jgi:ferritin-like metal-binding protein YciE
MAKTASRTAARKKAASQTTEEIGTELRNLFIDEIKDIYWAEKHLTKALPKMQKAANSEQLQQAFETHLQQTQEHVSRLEKVFEMLEEKAAAKKCEAMAGLVEEAESVISDTDDGTATRDVGLILSAQKVEHYEIAAYGGLTQLAKTLELPEIADVLAETLMEEKETDQLLTNIAENDINYEAKEEPVNDEE